MARKARNLTEVIDAVVAIVPELERDLGHVRMSAAYTAPEHMSNRWVEATEIIAARVPRKHPKHAEVAAIWNGTIVVEPPALEFMECDTCRAKAGMPELCRGCLHNRTAIERLKRR